jgi:hypothetical protein
MKDRVQHRVERRGRLGRRPRLLRRLGSGCGPYRDPLQHHLFESAETLAEALAEVAGVAETLAAGAPAASAALRLIPWAATPTSGARQANPALSRMILALRRTAPGVRRATCRDLTRMLPVYRGLASRGCHPRSAAGPHHRLKHHWSDGCRQGHQTRQPQQRLRRTRHYGRLQTLGTLPRPDLPLFQRPPQTPATPRVPRENWVLPGLRQSPSTRSLSSSPGGYIAHQLGNLRRDRHHVTDHDDCGRPDALSCHHPFHLFQC